MNKSYIKWIEFGLNKRHLGLQPNALPLSYQSMFVVVTISQTCPTFYPQPFLLPVNSKTLDNRFLCMSYYSYHTKPHLFNALKAQSFINTL